MSFPRVPISADADFGALLARQGTGSPSLLLLRGACPRRAADVAWLILANVPAVEADLDAGAVVVVTPERVRIRQLPLPPM